MEGTTEKRRLWVYQEKPEDVLASASGTWLHKNVCDLRFGNQMFSACYVRLVELGPYKRLHAHQRKVSKTKAHCLTYEVSYS